MTVVIDVEKIVSEVKSKGVEKIEIDVDEAGAHIILCFKDGKKYYAGEFDEELENKIDLMYRVIGSKFLVEKYDLPREEDGLVERHIVYGLEIAVYVCI